MSPLSPRRILLSTTVGIALALSAAAPAIGALIVVDTLEDGPVGAAHDNGNCSLREAFAAANANQAVDDCPAGNSSNDLILATLSGTVLLTQGVIGVSDDVVLTTASSTVIDGGLADRIFDVQMTNSSDDFEIQGNGLSLRRGRAVAGSGGAIWLRKGDRATLSGIHFENNEACSSVSGSTCVATSGPEVGGGAVRAEYLFPNLIVRDCTFVANLASHRGGALEVLGLNSTTGVYQTVTVTIERSDFIANQVGTEEDFADGAAIYAVGGATASILVDRSTVVWNAGASGTGTAAFLGLDVVVRNTLIVDNLGLVGLRAGGQGFLHELDLSYSTIARNHYGLTVFGSEEAVRRTLANAVTDNAVGDCAGPFTEALTSAGYNLESGDTCNFGSTLDLPDGSAELSGVFLGTDGRPVALPSVHSPLVDAGTSTSCADFVGAGTVPVDLHGRPRPTDGDGAGGARCDSGAVELPAGSTELFQDGFEAGSTAAWSSST